MPNNKDLIKKYKTLIKETEKYKREYIKKIKQLKLTSLTTIYSEEIEYNIKAIREFEITIREYKQFVRDLEEN